MKHCNDYPIVWRDEILKSDLEALFSKKIAALRVQNFVAPKEAEDISNRLINNNLYGKYANAPQIGRVGQAFFECQVSETARARYFGEATDWIRQIRKGCEPYLSPIDRLRLELDEVWPNGASIGQLSGKKMFVGLARHFGVGAEAEPHTDVLAWDAPDEADAQRLSDQLAWNTYLTVPDKGGELVLWDVWPDKDSYSEMKKPDSYGLRRELLPEPIATIKPKAGEMIIFHPQRVHAVQKTTRGSRVTWSCFIGKSRDDGSLFLWS